jgi:hypothetical protein
MLLIEINFRFFARLFEFLKTQNWCEEIVTFVVILHHNDCFMMSLVVRLLLLAALWLSLICPLSVSGSEEYVGETLASSGVGSPWQVWGDSNGDYVYTNNGIGYTARIALPSKAVSNFAGSGTNANHIAGPATSSPMRECRGVCGDTAGMLYVSCIGYDRLVRIVISTGEIEGNEILVQYMVMT